MKEMLNTVLHKIYEQFEISMQMTNQWTAPIINWYLVANSSIEWQWAMIAGNPWRRIAVNQRRLV